MNNDPRANFGNALASNRVLIKAPGHQKTIQWVLAATGILFALMLGLLVLLLIGIETGPVGLLIGMVLATIPVPIYIMLLLWIDRYEAEPWWMLATAFFWGALVAVFVAFILNTVSSGVVYAVTNNLKAGEAFGAVISAPLVEESSKALILFILFFWKKDEFDDIIDGIVYAGMVGLGFAMTENIQYYGKAALAGSTLTPVLILRGGLAPFSHPLFTSMTGIGLGWARQTTNNLIKWIAPAVGFLLAMFMHAMWNGSITFLGGVGFIGLYFFIMVPAFVATLVTIGFGLRREGRIVREQLFHDCQRGLFTEPEYNSLCTIHGRMGASLQALTNGGFRAWRCRTQFNQIASELAFHRSRVSRGIFTTPQSAAERESAYVQLLMDLRRQLGSNR
jgi:protease PrsW